MNVKTLSQKLNYPDLKIKEIENIINSSIPDKTLENDKTLVGIELELENISIEDWENYYNTYKKNALDLVKYWGIIQDGSLRNGIEFVTDPLSGNNIIKGLDCLDYLVEYVNPTNNLKISMGERTSLHVHLNVLDLTIEQLKNLVYVYIIFERCLFNTYAISRIKNNFCKPLYNSNFLEKFKSLLLDFQKEKYRYSDNSREIPEIVTRYYALNISSILKHGTVEFRHFTATLDKQLILERINFILSLRDIAIKYSGIGLTKMLNTTISNDTIQDTIHILFPLCPQFIESFRQEEQVDNLILGIEDIKLKLFSTTIIRQSIINEDKGNSKEFIKLFKTGN